MKNQALYKELGKYYDLIYHGKDYKKEAEGRLLRSESFTDMNQLELDFNISRNSE